MENTTPRGAFGCITVNTKHWIKGKVNNSTQLSVFTIQKFQPLELNPEDGSVFTSSFKRPAANLAVANLDAGVVDVEHKLGVLQLLVDNHRGRGAVGGGRDCRLSGTRRRRELGGSAVGDGLGHLVRVRERYGKVVLERPPRGYLLGQRLTASCEIKQTCPKNNEFQFSTGSIQPRLFLFQGPVNHLVLDLIMSCYHDKTLSVW